MTKNLISTLKFWVFASLILCSNFANAQNISISGVVKDEKGNPLNGATVVLKPGNKTTTSNAQGIFSFSVAQASYTLEISYVGYENTTQKVSSSVSNLIVVMNAKTDISEVVVVGSRSKQSRTVIASPAPIDIIPVSQIANEVGQVDVNQILTYVAPSFQSSKQAISDGTDHVDPAQLRGLGPDQILVLVNGKRRHQSALVNVNGTVNRGTVGTDMSTIPANAIERIEILRDGAAAQYGSDAIAGVINIVLKKRVNYLDANVSYGFNSTSFERDFARNKLANNNADPSVRISDGGTFQASLNYGFQIAKKGYLNVTGEYTQKEETNRGGTYTGQIYPNVNGVNRDDSIMNARGLNRNTFDMRIGNARMKGGIYAYNFNLPIGNGKTELYSFGAISRKNGNGAGFYRYPSSIASAAGSASFQNTVLSFYPNGFLPEIASIIIDRSFALGIKTTTANGWNLDLSNTTGQNNFNFDVLNSISYSQASVTTTPKLNFDAGGLYFTQNTTNFDASKKLNWLKGFNLAMGAEFRNERFNIRNGEEATVRDYNGTPAPPAGSQVFAGFVNTNGGPQNRTAFAIYNDNELDITKNWLVTAALRFENFSDFGSTFNYKFSTRYKISDNFNFRASTSTGFRAPSMQQKFYTKTNTLFVSGPMGLVPVESGTFTNNSVPAQLLGIPQLKQETSTNYSFGVTAKPFKGFEATLDYYIININNRIVLTNNFTGGTNAALTAQLNAAGAGAANFFSNAIDTRSSGLEGVLSYTKSFSKDQSLKISFAYTSIKNEVRKDAAGSPIIYASPTLVSSGQLGNYFNREDQSRIEVANPINKATLILNYKIKKWQALLRFVYFGEVTYLDPSINPANAAAFPVNAFTGNRETLDQTFSGKTVTDLSVTYNVNTDFAFTLGANNLFDVYQDRHNHSGNMSLGRFVYSRRVQQMGFNGSYFFARVRLGINTK